MPTINKPHRRRKKDTSIEDVERKKIYATKRWKQLRSAKFANSPLCEICLQQGKVTVAEDIHHITSFMSTDDPIKRQYLAYDYDNLMSLCKIHHQEIHNKKH